jgi:uncharacterized protein (DUF433 family)
MVGKVCFADRGAAVWGIVDRWLLEHDDTRESLISDYKLFCI